MAQIIVSVGKNIDQLSIATMPPKFTADALQSKYGGELEQPPFSDAATPRMLRNALMQRNPPLDVSDVFFLGGRITHRVYKGFAAP